MAIITKDDVYNAMPRVSRDYDHTIDLQIERTEKAITTWGDVDEVPAHMKDQAIKMTVDQFKGRGIQENPEDILAMVKAKTRRRAAKK